MCTTSRRNSRAQTRAGLCVLMTSVVVLMSAGAALADSVTMSVTTAAGESDPVAGVGRTFTVSGTSAVPTQLFVKSRPAGGAPCASSANTDSGTYTFGFSFTNVNGAFSIPLAQTWPTPGSYTFCYWLAPSSTAVATPFTQLITFRSPTGTITATFNPITLQVNQPATITITGATEAPAEVFAKIRPAGPAGCAPTYSADTGNSVLFASPVNGAFSLPVNTTQTAAGSFVLCLWLAQSSTDATPIAGPQPQPFNVIGPPPPPPPPFIAPPPSRVAATSTLRRRGARYSGRIVSTDGCRTRRTVVLRRVGSGSKSFGRAVSRANGTFTIKRGSRLHGQLYVTVLTRKASTTVICSTARSATIRG
jgi:hypothetical protein